jgi:hypothetical protein
LFFLAGKTQKDVENLAPPQDTVRIEIKKIRGYKNE